MATLSPCVKSLHYKSMRKNFPTTYHILYILCSLVSMTTLSACCLRCKNVSPLYNHQMSSVWAIYLNDNKLFHKSNKNESRFHHFSFKPVFLSFFNFFFFSKKHLYATYMYTNISSLFPVVKSFFPSQINF